MIELKIGRLKLRLKFFTCEVTWDDDDKSPPIGPDQASIDTDRPKAAYLKID